MFRSLRLWLASLFVAASTCLPAFAQAADEADKGRRPPVPEAAVAFVVTILVLAVVCVPSRRQ
jgi:hypothetical protein